MNEELRDALFAFWQFYWNECGIYDDGKPNHYLIDAKDQNKLDDLASHVEDLIVAESAAQEVA